jgi:hypothetical protein
LGTRKRAADAIAGDYAWTIISHHAESVSALDTPGVISISPRCKTDGITIPGLPANSFSVGFADLHGHRLAADRSNDSLEFQVHHFDQRSLLDTFTTVRGRHTIRFGTDIRREALDVSTHPTLLGRSRSPPPERIVPRPLAEML